MNVTVYSPEDHFAIIQTTKGFEKKIIDFHMSFHFMYLFIHLFIYIFIYWFICVFFNAFPPKITLVRCQGWGWGGGCYFVGMATGSRSDVQWAKKWRTVGQNLTYTGLKSYVWAKMQQWGVIINHNVWYMILCDLLWYGMGLQKIAGIYEINIYLYILYSIFVIRHDIADFVILAVLTYN